MDEYIKRIDANYAVTDAIWHGKRSMHDVASAINSVHSADVAPVRHGRWLNFYGDFSTAECDICAEIYEVSPDEPCRKEFFDAFKEFYKFCPNCGAKMDGGAD